MTDTTRRIAGRAALSVPIAALAAAGLACSLVDLALGRLPTASPTPSAAVQPAITLPPPALVSTPQSSPTAATPPPSSPAAPSADVQAQMDVIQDQVVKLRGLQPKGPVGRTLLTPEQLRQRVLDDFLKDYTPDEALTDARQLALLGLLEPGFDLRVFYIDLYSEQIAGYYDDRAKQMLVVGGQSFDGPERLTYAHEYDHALQDQTYDLEHGLGYSPDACPSESERCAALQALVEGDATLLEEQWLRTYATAQDQRQILGFYGSFRQPVYDSAPAFMKEDFVFPYAYGLAFVQALFLKGGWAAVDAAYAHPPTSTEQILHPERYPRDQPEAVSLPDLLPALGAGWRRLDQGLMGEWTLRLMLEAQLPSDASAKAAAGWGGDAYQAFYNDVGGQGALVLAIRWDALGDAQEAALALQQYGEGRIGPRTAGTSGATWESPAAFALLEVAGDQTLWIQAPDAPTGQALRRALTFPLRNP